MSELVFVEEYRKELQATGYPFTRLQPIVTSSGYTLSFGAIVDASVYYEDADSIPSLQSVRKENHRITFQVGPYSGTLDLRDFKEVVQLYTTQGLFGGILVCDEERLRTIKGWPNGTHVIQPNVSFCPRCLEYIPEHGVSRFRSDTGELFSGYVALVSGQGGALRSQTTAHGFDFVRVDYFGDPTYYQRNASSEHGLPIQKVVCVDSEANEFLLEPGPGQDVSIVVCNPLQNNLYPETLRIDTSGSSVSVSLIGL